MENGINFTYSNLSCGYIGNIHKNATLNSQYYYALFSEINQAPEILSNILIFPQRIPRAGFFDELATIESCDFRTKLRGFLDLITQKYKHSIIALDTNKTEITARIFINWTNIFLRYCRFDNIINAVQKEYSGPYELEIKVLRETGRIEADLSNERTISLDNLLKLSVECSELDATSIREKIMLLNRIIVYFNRHLKKRQINSPLHNEVINLSEILLDLIDGYNTGNFMAMFNSSIAYRGLSMVSEFGRDKQSSLLDKAEELARSISGKTPLEKITAAENLYTCLQTLSKWNQIEDKLIKAEENIHEMISIDPNDSTGHSELGFLYMKVAKHSVAADSFKKAMELGPPGAGMNAYYYAKCLEETGRSSEAIEYLHQSAMLDNQAITPLLDLFEYYKDNNLSMNASQISKHIMSTPILREQLESEEIRILQDFIN